MKTRNRLWMLFTVLATAICLSGCQYHRDLMNRNKCWPFVSSEPPGAACAVEPPFFGFHATCWRPWPADWVGCPELIVEEVITPVEAGQDAPAAPMEPLPMDDAEPMPLQDTPPENAQPPAANESVPENPPVPDEDPNQPTPVAPPAGSEPPPVPDQQTPPRSGRRTTPPTPTPVSVDQTFKSAIDRHLQPIPSSRPTSSPTVPEVDYRSVIQDVAGDLRHSPPEPLVVTPNPLMMENHTYRPAIVENQPPAAPAARLSEFVDFDVKPAVPVTTPSTVVVKEHVAARGAEPTPIQEVVEPPVDAAPRVAEPAMTAKRPLTLKPVKAVVVGENQPVRRKAAAILVSEENPRSENAGKSDEPGLLEVGNDVLRPAPILEASKLREGQ